MAAHKFAISLLMATVPAVGAAGGLTVTTPYPAVAVAPGSKVSFDLTVTSVRDATVAVSLRGVPNGWTASLLGGGNVVDSVTTTADKPGTLRLDVTVPADAASGSKTLTVAASGGGGSDELPITIRVDAAAAGDVSLTTTTPTLTGASDAKFSFELTFKNDTPQDVTLSVQATGPDGWTVTPTLTGETQAASSVVTAGSTQNVTVAVSPAIDAPAGQYPIEVVASAGDRTTKAELGIEITGSYSATLSTPNDLLSASGSAGSPTTMTFDITNTGTAPITNVKLTGTPPSNWTVTFDPETVASIAPNETGTITATVTPSSEAVAGDYVVTFESSATEPGATANASIRFTVETSPIWAIVGIAIIVLILAGLGYVFRTYGRR
jgi:uncharacterized repeat protein (TIGR01451 family)